MGSIEYRKSNKKSVRERVFEIIQIGGKSDFISRLFDFIIMLMILINIVVSICLTFTELNKYNHIFNIIDTITVMGFTVEFAIRLWTAEYLYKKGSILSALRYLFSLNGFVEFGAILPFYLPLFFPKGIIAFRMFRVFRILRLFQANAYSNALSTILIVIKRKRSQLLSSMLIIFAIMIMSSLVMYGFEHPAQPEVFRNAFSGIWWATSTLLTVGYGDIYPITIQGKIASILITFLGVGMVAIPTGILSAGFTEYMSERKEEKRKKKKAIYCPYCGEKLPK